MKILISNDDGYDAPGLLALYDVLRPYADIKVVAPKHNQSGASNALSLHRALHVHQNGSGTVVVDGTPADCVHMAFTALMNDKPDLVLSGINQGQNMGDDTIYSGTVAAATEGYLFHVPSIAFSQVDKGWEHIEAAAQWAKLFVLNEVPKIKAVQPHFLLNINIPNVAYEALKSFHITRLGKRHCSEPVILKYNEHGQKEYWIGPAGQAKDAGEGTDFYAVAQGHVSITPLQIDLTHFVQRQALQTLYNQIPHEASL